MTHPPTHALTTSALVSLCAAAVLSLTGCATADSSPASSTAGSSAASAEPSTEPALVIRLTDGDTMRVLPLSPQDPLLEASAQTRQREASQRSAQDTTAVRVLGINTPEVPHGARPGQCGGEQATEVARQLITTGTVVRLTKDPHTPDTDRYHRALRYVSTENHDFSKYMLDAGYADAYAPASQKPQPQRMDQYRRAAHKAHAQGRGAWGQCGSITKAAPST